MKKFSLQQLLENNRIDYTKKRYFFVPAVIVVIAIIMSVIFHFTLGDALNLGTDFAGGYSMDIKLGTKLTDSNYNSYINKITKIFEELKDKDGNSYGLKVSNTQRQGTNETSSIHIMYKAVADEDTMLEEVNPAIQSALEKGILNIIPIVTVTASEITLVYPEVRTDIDFESDKQILIDCIAVLNSDNGAGIVNAVITHNANDKKIINVTFDSIAKTDSEIATAIVDAMVINAPYAGEVSQGNTVGATVGRELITTAILSIALAILFMLSYIGLRFQISSGLATIIGIMHDLIIMMCAMAIFHIEINVTIIAALITILAYSINNTIIIFDCIRDNMASVYSKNMTRSEIANKSISETMMRSINTTITTLIVALMVAIIGVPEIRIFIFPIIIGLLSGLFSSLFITPTLWVMFQKVIDNVREKRAQRVKPAGKLKKEKA